MVPGKKNSPRAVSGIVAGSPDGAAHGKGLFGVFPQLGNIPP
jgi:hypothetical protein